MSTPSDPNQPCGMSPAAHWHARDELAEETLYAAVISPTQAVCEALAAVGRDAPLAQVRRQLEERGVHVDDALIERVRAGLPGSCK